MIRHRNGTESSRLARLRDSVDKSLAQGLTNLDPKIRRQASQAARRASSMSTYLTHFVGVLAFSASKDVQLEEEIGLQLATALQILELSRSVRNEADWLTERLKIRQMRVLRNALVSTALWHFSSISSDLVSADRVVALYERVARASLALQRSKAARTVSDKHDVSLAGYDTFVSGELEQLVALGVFGPQLLKPGSYSQPESDDLFVRGVSRAFQIAEDASVMSHILGASGQPGSIGVKACLPWNYPLLLALSEATCGSTSSTLNKSRHGPSLAECISLARRVVRPEHLVRAQEHSSALFQLALDALPPFLPQGGFVDVLIDTLRLRDVL